MGERRFDLRAIWREARRVVEEVARAGSDDNVPMMAAAISYYLLVAIAPLALLVSLVAGTAAKTAATTGTAGPEALRQSLAAVSSEGSTAVVVVVLAIVLFGAAGVFSQFVLAVTRIWKEPPVRGPIYSFARRHGLAFLLLGVLAVGLLASAVAGAALSMIVREVMALATELGIELPPLDAIISGRVVVDFLASFLLFLAAFTMIPARKPRIRDVAPGAAMTALAYSLGQIALGLYLANSNRVALLGGAGSTIAVLLWVYYSSMIALYGAELTRVLVLSGKNVQEP